LVDIIPEQPTLIHVFVHPIEDLVDPFAKIILLPLESIGEL